MELQLGDKVVNKLDLKYLKTKEVFLKTIESIKGDKVIYVGGGWSWLNEMDRYYIKVYDGLNLTKLYSVWN